MVDNIDSDHLCYIYLASYSSPAEIPGKSILSSISITVQACANDLNKTTLKNLSKNLSNVKFIFQWQTFRHGQHDEPDWQRLRPEELGRVGPHHGKRTKNLINAATCLQKCIQ